MIGDVKKARKKLVDLLGKQEVENVLKWMKGKEDSSPTVDNIVSEVSKRLKIEEEYDGEKYGQADISMFSSAISEIIRLLSTGPHTNSSGNFCKLVKNNSREIWDYISHPYDIEYNKLVYNDLNKYLKLTNKPGAEGSDTEGWRRQKFKNLESKLKSFFEVNRLKVLVVALVINLFVVGKQKRENKKAQKEQNFRQNMEEQRKEREERDKREKEEREKREREEQEKERKEKEERKQAEEKKRQEEEEKRKQRWSRGEVTLDEFNRLVSYDWNERLKPFTKLIIPKGAKIVGYDKLYGVDHTFENLNLREVFIPNSVTEICKDAFYRCRNLEQVTIEDGGKLDIGNFAFGRCENLKSIDIPGSVKKIGYGAFEGCTSLATVKIGNGTTVIEDRAFENCEKLKTITVPKSVTKIGTKKWEEAFRGCDKDINVLGDASEEIKNIIRKQADANDKKIRDKKARDERFAENIGKLANGTATKEDYDMFLAYTEYQNLDKDEDLILRVNKLVIPEGVEELKPINNFKRLVEVVIPGSVQKIPQHWLSSCQFLTKVEILDGVKEIGHMVFCGLKNLQSIVMPDSLVSMGESVFSGCTSLQKVVIPSKVTRIEKSTFSGCSSLVEVEIKEGVQYIGKNAFSECGNLRNITIPKSLMFVDEKAFEGCPKNMEIKGDASESIQKMIRAQL